ncbi:MAG: T9SS type A sorting domain-containing protein, partial [Bacteroidota bacterium]
DEDVPTFDPEWSDNCDDELELSAISNIGGDDCTQIISRSWTATDACGNSTTVSQTITITDTTDPELSIEDESVTIECNASISLPSVEATDNCDENVEITTGFEMIPGSCENEWTEVYTWTATDDCGNTDMATLTVNYVDTTAPEFDFVPGNEEVSCDVALPTAMATATDNCDDDVTVTMEDAIDPGFCLNTYTVIRTWTATDNCGNSNTTTTEYYVYDDEAPVFDFIPQDISVECADDVPAMVAPTATDNCGTATVFCTTTVLEEDDCGNYVAEVTCVASDECLNTSSVTYTITVNDTTAPEFDQDLPASMTIDCEADVPAAEECTATDNCGGDVTVTFTEEIIGDLPTPGSSADCVASTPAPYEGGELCTGDDPWSMVLFDFLGMDEVFYSALEAQWVEFPDGTATLTAVVVRNDDPTRGYNVNVNFENGMDWDMWSSQGFPTGFKDDCNIAGDTYLDWTYYIMSAGATLTGWGGNEGNTIMLAHAPSGFYYGYQVGTSANNVNDAYGSGGWFTFTGIVDGVEVSGSGDFAFDHDCCPTYEIERTWTAEDCSGNIVSFTQVINFGDVGIDPPIVDPVTAGRDEVAQKGEFDIVKVAPNPATEQAVIEFKAYTNNTVVLEVYDLSGRVVGTLYDGNIVKGETYRTTFDASAVQSGLYTIRLSSLTSAKYEKLSVAK